MPYHAAARPTAPRRAVHARLLLLAGMLCVIGAAHAARPASAQTKPVTLTVDGTQRYQQIDGFGVNINSNQWENGALAPVLDTLIDTVGIKTWRVIVESHENWEPSPTAGSGPIDWAYYDRLYETPKFQSLWAVLGYLAQRGQQQVFLNVMGGVPDSLGRSEIRPNAEDRWVEMIASLIAYGRQTKGLPIAAISPMNEVDIGFPEGPRVDPAQYVRLLRKLSAKLDDLGLGDVAFVPPDIASPGRAAAYFGPLLSDPTLMAKIAHLSLHDYGGNTGNAAALIAASAYPDRNLWVTEFSAPCGGCDTGSQSADQWDFAAGTVDQLISYLEQGAASALIYDGYDSVYEHHQSIGHWGLLAYDPAGRTYTPRKRLYAAAQADRFTGPGMTRIGATSSDGELDAVAFSDPSGALTIFGHNRAAAPVTLRGALTGLPAVASLSLFQTTPTTNLAPGPAVAVTGGAFSATIDANSIFTLTTLSGPAAGGTDTSTPRPPDAATPAPTAPPGGNAAPVTVLVGETNLGPERDSNPDGMAEAFRFTATASGSVDTLAVYLDESSTARMVLLGLYAGAGADVPGRLLTQATVSAPVPGA